ncbi:NtaA/DmoA family FMN-dependent monooxygenase [Rhodococcus koreensis]
MERNDRLMNLVMFLSPTGQRWTWRDSSSPIEELWGLDLPVRITQQAERAKFDALFIGSWLVHEGGDIGRQPFTAGYEPFTLMGALAARTERIGLIGTASTTFVHPYNMARFMTSLDWLSAGRIGWNVVTSSGGAEHYGIEMPAHTERYLRAQEYLSATNALWDAWDDDAVVNDRQNGVWARSSGIHPVDFRGEHVRVSGQLFMHRSPQGRPVIVQAGQSAAGMEFAARNAEVVFTAQSELGAAKEFYRELKERAAAAGRDPGAIRILPGVMPIVGATTAEAEALEARLDEYVDLEVGREQAAATLQANLDGLDPDEPIPSDRLISPDSVDVELPFGSRYRNFYNLAVHQRVPLRRIIANISRTVGHNAATGSAEDIADLLQEWFEAGACDGFAITPVSMPEGLDGVCHHLVPELQRRGLARTEYDGATLRDHLGLVRPPLPARGGAATVSAHTAPVASTTG